MFARFSPYWLWALLAVPAMGMLTPFFDEDTRALRGVIHGSGEFAARFMTISMMATPLLLLTKGSRFARWLRANRRYFGVAAFGYAALHTLAYVLVEGSLARILAEATAFANGMGAPDQGEEALDDEDDERGSLLRFLSTVKP